MIYPEVNLEDWLMKYGLKVVNFRCPKCGGNFATDRPVLMSDCAGLESAVHGCGPDFTKVILAPRSPKAKEFWRRVMDSRT